MTDGVPTDQLEIKSDKAIKDKRKKRKKRNVQNAYDEEEKSEIRDRTLVHDETVSTFAQPEPVS